MELDQGGSVADLSHPAREIKKKLKEATRKPQGRKHKEKPYTALRCNWFTPFLFQQIEDARIAAGGATWSTRAIVRELRKRNKNFFKLNRSTMEYWINRSGKKPRWSDQTLERIRKGNDVAHANVGRKGVLVSHRSILSYR
jgi:hypothetical protein